MPSKLTNLFKTLTWQDFKTSQRNDPGPPRLQKRQKYRSGSRIPVWASRMSKAA
jgi:hypothetical protein